MRNFPQFVIAVFFICFVSNTYGQRKGRAKLRKNYNIQAAQLYHDLNKTNDTLILRSDKKINYLYRANSGGENDLKVRINENSYKLPLNQLKKGRNVLVAIQVPLQIVFVVEIEEEYPKPPEKVVSIIN